MTREPVFRNANAETKKVGYELIDYRKKEVWATVDFTPEEFADFSPPAGWMKNQPREGLPDSGKFLKSPECDQQGQYTYLHAFDKEFLNVVKLVGANVRADSAGLVRETKLEKYHVIGFRKGTSVSILHDPSGTRYILMSRDANRRSETFAVPDGWAVTAHELSNDIDINLSGIVRVLRMQNEDSYQGPIPDDLNL